MDKILSNWNSKNNKEVKDLLLLKGLTQMTGALHQLQLDTIKNWCLLLFNENKECQFTWDLEDKIVYFEMKPKVLQSFLLFFSTRKLKKKLSMFENWIRFILGNSWSIQVELPSGKNNKIIYGKVLD